MPRLEPSPIRVALALVWRQDEILLTQRPQGVHLPGLWEFPGGKLEAGETAEAAAEREVREETGMTCRALRVRPTLSHRYPDRLVELIPVDCAWRAGEARCLAVAEVRWVVPAQLAAYPFPEANRPLLAELMNDPQAPSTHGRSPV